MCIFSFLRTLVGKRCGTVAGAVFLFLLVCLAFMNEPVDASSAVPKNSWRELSNPKSLLPVNGATYYHFQLENGSDAHIVVAYLKEGKWRVRPFIGEKTAPTSAIAAKQGASAAVNGGFFNLSDGLSASYLTLDGKLVADPHDNKALVENPKLKDFLPRIFNRSEIRVLKKKGASAKIQEIQIAKHDEPLPKGFELLDAIQAGPRLLPVLQDEEEAFLRKQTDGTLADSISCRKPAARTAFGITPDGYAIFLAVSGKGQDKESSGISLAQLADLMRRLGCRQAINLDGGSSTSMYVRMAEPESAAGASVCAKDPETLVKSVLLLLPQ